MLSDIHAKKQKDMKDEINHQACQILAYKKLFDRNKKREE